jgi:hypothetical protein
MNPAVEAGFFVHLSKQRFSENKKIPPKEGI